MAKITIVGCGPGSAEYVTPAATSEVAGAELFIAARHLHPLFSTGAERMIVGSDIETILQAIAVNRKRRIVVGVSGDPGVASLAKNIIQRFGSSECRIVPGVSSIAVAFARLGIDWTDARIVNTHSGMPPVDRSLAETKVIAILAGAATLQWIDRLYALSVVPRIIHICENLTLPDERIRVFASPETIPGDLSTRTVLILTIKDTA